MKCGKTERKCFKSCWGGAENSRLVCEEFRVQEVSGAELSRYWIVVCDG